MKILNFTFLAIVAFASGVGVRWVTLSSEKIPTSTMGLPPVAAPSESPWFTYEGPTFSFEHPSDCKITDFMGGRSSSPTGTLVSYLAICDQDIATYTSSTISVSGGVIPVGADGSVIFDAGFFKEPTVVTIKRQRRSSDGLPLALTPSDSITVGFPPSAVSVLNDPNVSFRVKAPSDVADIEEIASLKVFALSSAEAIDYFKNAFDGPDKVIAEERVLLAGYEATKIVYEDGAKRGAAYFISKNSLTFMLRDYGADTGRVEKIFQTFRVE